MTTNRLVISIGLIGLFGCATAQASCGSTACTINTNWDEHSAIHPGWTTGLSYGYSRAGTLRSGSSRITANPTDPALVGAEVENLRTINTLVTATLDYTHDEHWGVMLHLPYVMRDHTHTIGAAAAPFSTESFSANSLGDIKVIGRYRWALDEASGSGMGVKFGLKLNTGKRDFQLVDATGPIGVPTEVTLQPGNGSTDLILGLLWNQSAPGSDWSWFAQGTVQSPVKSDTAFRPGNQINLDGGARYAFNGNLSGLLQLNAQWNGQDSGASAAATATGAPGSSSGGKIYSITPGLSYAFTPDTQVYGLVQLPLYQFVNGEQLTADSSFTLGISHRF